MLPQIKSVIREIVPENIISPIYDFGFRTIWRRRGIKVRFDKQTIHIRKRNKEILLSRLHQIYLNDFILNFDFYFSGVESRNLQGIDVVDYSKPSWHDVIGFDLMPVHFNSCSEPLETTWQYVEFAELGRESIVLDLGAYSALTSIIFDQCINGDGLVISVEADADNFRSCLKNLALYNKITNRRIELVNAAIWNHEDGISFSTEGNMGSSAVEIVGENRGRSILIPSITLLGLAEKFNLPRVDFIKCDIEGAEEVALNCEEFFFKFRPKIIIECHVVDGRTTVDNCKALMETFGYHCEFREQNGYPLPLLFCSP